MKDVDLVKQIKNQICKNSKEMQLQNSILKATSNGVKIMKNGSEIGRLDYIYSTGKFISYGSLLGLKVNLYVSNCDINNIIEDICLNFEPNNLCKFYPLFINSFETDKDDFFKDGKIEFFGNDDIPRKVEKLIEKISDLYLSKADNFVNHKKELKTDILKYPNNYSYPFTFLLINEHLNNKSEYIDVDELFNLGKANKLYDAKDKFRDEIIDKVINYFGNVPDLAMPEQITD